MIRKSFTMVRKKSSMERKKLCHGEKSYHGMVKYQKKNVKTAPTLNYLKMLKCKLTKR